jgi:hypothetical protein
MRSSKLAGEALRGPRRHGPDPSAIAAITTATM